MLQPGSLPVTNPKQSIICTWFNPSRGSTPEVEPHLAEEAVHLQRPLGGDHVAHLLQRRRVGAHGRGHEVCEAADEPLLAVLRLRLGRARHRVPHAQQAPAGEPPHEHGVHVRGDEHDERAEDGQQQPLRAQREGDAPELILVGAHVENVRPQHEEAGYDEQREGTHEDAPHGHRQEQEAVVVAEVFGVAAEAVQAFAHAVRAPELAHIHQHEPRRGAVVEAADGRHYPQHHARHDAGKAAFGLALPVLVRRHWRASKGAFLLFFPAASTYVLYSSASAHTDGRWGARISVTGRQRQCDEYVMAPTVTSPRVRLEKWRGRRRMRRSCFGSNCSSRCQTNSIFHSTTAFCVETRVAPPRGAALLHHPCGMNDAPDAAPPSPALSQPKIFTTIAD
mmetsp:Transcript_3925/g.9415  ORF Transcript_3925/g.9415 Transcript_3925/m.9415 type:complete len:393 (-) Transcript_3925:118-1296(-)